MAAESVSRQEQMIVKRTYKSFTIGLRNRTQQNQISHILFEPGHPMQNVCIESFNGTFRDEWLKEHWFTSLADRRKEIARWRSDDNEVRLHSSCRVCRRRNLLCCIGS